LAFGTKMEASNLMRIGNSDSNLVLMPGKEFLPLPSVECCSPVLQSPASLSELVRRQQEWQERLAGGVEILLPSTPIVAERLHQMSSSFPVRRVLKVPKGDVESFAQMLKLYNATLKCWT